ncbi:MAG: tetratricopeptide repeat protein [Chloroflexi bacterium]|nr:tetratricopeptide repeat protein [Chloroflexota bacterium]
MHHQNQRSSQSISRQHSWSIAYFLAGLMLLTCLLVITLGSQRPSANPAAAAMLPTGTPGPFVTPDSDTLAEHARLLYQAERPLAAFNAAQTVITRLEPEEDTPLNTFETATLFRAYFLRGQIYFDREEYAAALADFGRAIELQPEIAEAYAARADVLRAQDNLEDALLDYTRAIEYDNSEPAYYVARGRAYIQLCTYRLAIIDFNDALAFNDTYADAYYYRGIANTAIEDYEAAIEDFAMALDLTPDNARIYRERGFTYLAADDPESARTDLLIYLERAPDAPDRAEVEAALAKIDAEAGADSE